MTGSLTIVVRPAAGGLFEARLEGQQQVLCRSASPFTAAARELAAHALHDPEVVLYMKHEGSDAWALRGRLRDVAQLSVVDRKGRGLDMEGWKPWQTKSK
jgi:hypothetical protein